MSSNDMKLIEGHANRLLGMDLPPEAKNIIRNIRYLAQSGNGHYEDLEEQLAVIEQLGYQDNG